MTSSTGTVTTVMHDTADLERAVAFWTEILGLEVVYESENYAYLSRLSPEGPHLAFQQVPEDKIFKNRLHLDIRVDDPDRFVERVIALGGERLGEHQEGDYPPWTIMADPEGNEFCIYALAEPADET